MKKYNKLNISIITIMIVAIVLMLSVITACQQEITPDNDCSDPSTWTEPDCDEAADPGVDCDKPLYWYNHPACQLTNCTIESNWTHENCDEATDPGVDCSDTAFDEHPDCQTWIDCTIQSNWTHEDCDEATDPGVDCEETAFDEHPDCQTTIDCTIQSNWTHEDCDEATDPGVNCEETAFDEHPDCQYNPRDPEHPENDMTGYECPSYDHPAVSELFSIITTSVVPDLYANARSVDNYYDVGNEIITSLIYLANKHPDANSHLPASYTEAIQSTALRDAADSLVTKVMTEIDARTGTEPTDIFDGQDLETDSIDLVEGEPFMKPAGWRKEDIAKNIIQLIGATLPKDGSTDEAYIQNISATDIQNVIDTLYIPLKDATQAYYENHTDTYKQHPSAIERNVSLAVLAASSILRYCKDKGKEPTLTVADVERCVSLRDHTIYTEKDRVVTGQGMPPPLSSETDESISEYWTYNRPLTNYLCAQIRKYGREGQEGYSTFEFTEQIAQDAHEFAQWGNIYTGNATSDLMYGTPPTRSYPENTSDGGFYFDPQEWHYLQEGIERSQEVMIAENPDIFYMAGNLRVDYANRVLVREATTNIGNVPSEETIDIYVSNSSASDVTITDIVIDSGDFTVAENPGGSVLSPDDYTVIKLSTDTAGVHTSGTITIYSDLTPSSYNFAVTCDALSTVVWSDDFNDSDITDWTITDTTATGGEWQLSTDYEGQSINGTPFMLAYGESESELVSPLISGTETNGLSKLILRFSSSSTCYFFITTDGGGTWEPMNNYSDYYYSHIGSYNYSLYSYIGDDIQFKFVFDGVGDTGANILLDNFTVFGE